MRTREGTAANDDVNAINADDGFGGKTLDPVV